MKRILYVIGSLEVGGTELHLVQIARQLKILGWSPEFFVFQPAGLLSKYLQEAEIPFFTCYLPAFFVKNFSPRINVFLRMLLIFFKLILLILFRRPAVIHYFLPAAYIVGGLAAILAFARPRVMSRRSLNHYHRQRPMYIWAERFLHPFMDRVCGNSMAVMKQLSDEGISENRLRLIYSGVDLNRFSNIMPKNRAREKLGIPDDAMVFIMVANLIPYKGHMDLITAFSVVNDRLPDGWICLLVGRDDGIGQDLKAHAKSVGLAPNFWWLGVRLDVPDLLAASDIGLLCSHEESFSNFILEAMATGLPMVVTNVGGNAEAVIDGVSGYVVSDNSSVELAEAILSVATNPRRHLLGMSGRQRVEEFFTMTACVRSYNSFYMEVLNLDSSTN